MDAQNKNITCATDAEIDSVFDRLSVNVALMNQFVDVNDNSANPIKTLIKTQYMTSNSMLSSNQIIKISQNYVILSDSQFSSQLDQQNLTYYSTRLDAFFTASQLNSEANMSLYLALDENVFTSTRVVYTVADALSTTGGFLGIISIILNYLLCWLQDIIFYQQIIYDMFYVEKQNDMPRVLIENSQYNLKLNPSIGLRENQDSSNRNQLKIKDNCDQYQTILNSIKQRVKFKFTLGDLIRALCLCIRTASSKKIQLRRKLFQIARQKIDKRFEIERIFETMKTTRLLNKIILSKYQRMLTPYFRSSLVRIKVDLSDIKNADQKQNHLQQKEEVSDWQSMSKLQRRQLKFKVNQEY
ncbi:UNKNOWN [Stylonychia lemnae]|uniref:Uncharacterized protein n=1 Tax=Stylonychia lemnae TaxID=5949 RepID=A0A078AD39_STYLE|nr:UNKNOWN [Stylonychia lemnae]|eukprot:CDW78778.1 UNKNOWN [Stylonychia lemnae]